MEIDYFYQDMFDDASRSIYDLEKIVYYTLNGLVSSLFDSDIVESRKIFKSRYHPRLKSRYHPRLKSRYSKTKARKSQRKSHKLKYDLEKIVNDMLNGSVSSLYDPDKVKSRKRLKSRYSKTKGRKSQHK